MRPDTLAVQFAQDPDPSTGALVSPIHATTTFAQDEPGVHRGFEQAVHREARASEQRDTETTSDDDGQGRKPRVHQQHADERREYRERSHARLGDDPVVTPR